MQAQPRRTKWRLVGKWVGFLILAFASLYVVLLIPDQRHSPRGAGRVPFEWKQNTLWSDLEKQFTAARGAGCDASAARIDSGLERIRRSIGILREQPVPPTNALFASLEAEMFSLAPLIAACPKRLNDYVAAITESRSVVKRQSEHWDLTSPTARQTLYRHLFGARMAIEEVLLQASSTNGVPALTVSGDEPSRTPAVNVLGITLHSGDILVSRGGAPTSALIARGNDYPGSFSHVALLHVDEKTGRAAIIESLSQRGVVTTSVEDFLKDKKLRLMVLRVRSDFPALIKEPGLPHRAATHMLNAATRRHIPYDFALNHQDHSSQFCSEVAAAGYEECGINLWVGMTYISLPNAIAWLGSLGVRQFETKEPADLEYDPQLRIVAEWREPATLFKAHVDDAVTDVMLEGAPNGEPLDYDLALLPLARLAKGYSAILTRLGKVGPIPEGMSATVALRVEKYQKEHAAIAERVIELAGQFKTRSGYNAPYWELVKLAQQAQTERRRR